MKKIKIPKVPSPKVELCYKQPGLDSRNPMLHCDRQLGHGGLHTWEMAWKIDDLEAQLANCK